MRITNGMITNNFMANLNNNLERMDKYQTQLATNKRITKLSDDPIGVISSMQARVKLYRIEQYQNNIEDVKTWLTQTETSVLEMNEVVKSAYEASLQAANSYMSPEDKNSIAELIGQLRDEVVTIGNSKNGDKYIFAGYNSSKPPFTVDSTTGAILYNGLDLTNSSNAALIAENGQKIEFEIGYGMKAQVSMPGTQLLSMGPDNIYSVLNGLYNALKNDASAQEISAYSQKLQNNQSNLMAVEAELGGRTNRLELVANRYEEDFINYTDMKSTVEDADQAEVIMQYKMAEAVYQSALKVGSDIIQPSLLDYLD